MFQKYKYLFPFEKVSPNSRIVIYGASDVGIDYMYQVRVTNYCKLVALLDKNHEAQKQKPKLYFVYQHQVGNFP